MRLHRLEITAFGPFADTAEVDFDRLSDGQVFLLCGDTGAGKTTVLDAICFALYGDVPSDRASARQLRSHHAEPSAAPRVVLEATVADRRLRFTRSPAWQRPKKRGAGTTTEHAHVRIEERAAASEWVLRTTRLDEAGHLATELMGMTLEQFSQVVLLPQNQFDRFLHATSEDRQKVLTRLFRTARFERVERWFGERRRELHRSSRAHCDAVAGVLHRLSETSGAALPDDWELDRLEQAVTSGEVSDWTGRLIRAGDRRQKAAARVEGATRSARARARDRLDEVRRIAELRERHARASAQQAALQESAQRAVDVGHRLRTGRLAAQVAPFLELADAAAAAHEDACRTTAELLALAGTGLEVDPDELDERRIAREADACSESLARARAMVPRASELDRVDRRAVALRAEIGEVDARLAEARDRVAALPDQVEHAERLAAGDRELVAVAADRRTALGRARDALAAGRERDELAVEVSRARERLTALREHAADRREALLELRERRLTGMAAELATALAVGEDCPVCGSREHPSPALAEDAGPTRSEEDDARAALDDAELAVTVQEDHLRGLQTRVAGATARAEERSVADLETAVRDLEKEVAACSDAEASLPEREAAAKELRDLLEQLADRVRDDEAGRAAAQATLAGLEDRLTAGRLELEKVQDGAPDLDTRIGALEQTLDVLRRTRDSLKDRERCARQASSAADRAAREAADRGFETIEAVRSALVDQEEMTALEAELAERTRAEAESARVLGDAEVLAAMAGDEPDVGSAERDAAAAEEALETAAARLHEATDRATRLRSRADELDAALQAWAPVRTEHQRVRELAELVEGKGADNIRQVRLSAYVLSARLSQVVDAANERLVRMSDGRYLLEHTDRRGAGDRRGGLGLLVLDEWTDERRDPVTLSGGETFVVSLALALGLADVVTAESGGRRIDTLFVDEGFGSLDPDTLELVMDTLDGLREGGRVVGVVSHVSEMRDRIPTRLEVHKHRAGSRLQLHG